MPLNALALTELEALGAGHIHDLVFTTTGNSPPAGWSKAKRRLDQAIDNHRRTLRVDAWQTHDLRRTVATGLQRLGVRFEVTEAILNHVSGARSGVAGVYQRHNWDVEKRQAMKAWSDMVCSLVSDPLDLVEKANVVSFDAVAGFRR